MSATAPDYGVAGEARLRQFVEALTGGRITRMERQVRWRPAWFADVDVAGKTLHLHLRGDREGDVAIFPELKREADVMEVLAEHGIVVPRIHGYCTDPPCIVMDALPGTRDMAAATSDTERSAVAREYMAQVAAMHRLPVEPFVARGLDVPHGAQAIALVGLEAYLPLYHRTKSRPEPMLEFVIGWLRRHAPGHRTRAAFIQFDSGQFLYHAGRLTGLYDFEFSMIGDPMVDLATMRMRDSIEPLGDDMGTLFRHYEECAGQLIDDAVVEYHTLLFATLGTMQFTGTVGRPTPGDPHDVYLEFDLALRQVMLHAMCTLTGTTLVSPPALTETPSSNETLIAKLADTIGRIETDVPIDQARKESAAKLLEWMARANPMGEEAREHDLADVSALLAQRFEHWTDAERALEIFVKNVGPEHDLPLLELFGAIEGRRLQVYGPTRIGRSAANVHLPPIR